MMDSIQTGAVARLQNREREQRAVTVLQNLREALADLDRMREGK